MKGEHRTAVLDMTPDRKRYLLNQNKLMSSSASATSGPSSPLVPLATQPIGSESHDSRRFSLASFAPWRGEVPSSEAASLPAKAEQKDPVVQSITQTVTPRRPILQTRGNIFSNWWPGTSSSSESVPGSQLHNLEWYLSGIKGR